MPLVPLGSMLPMSALGTYSDGSHQDLTSSLTWAVTQPQVVSVSPQGLLTSNKAGQSLVEAVFNALGASTTVTVSDIQPTSIQVTPSLATVFSGATIQMQATASFADGGTLDITRFVEWSSPPGLLAITPGGLVSTPLLPMGRRRRD